MPMKKPDGPHDCDCNMTVYPQKGNAESNGSQRLVDEMRKSSHRCVSLRDRFRQYFVTGGFEDCSKLEDCGNTLARVSYVDPEMLHHCRELWARFEGISTATLEVPVWRERSIHLETWNSVLPSDLQRRAQQSFLSTSK